MATPQSNERAGYVFATLRRLPGTVGVWSIFAAATGVSMAPSGGTITVVAMIIAALIVYVPLGVLTAVVGARWKETLIIGALGMLAAFATALLAGRPDAPRLAVIGLSFGGMLGGTMMTVAYRLPKLVLGQLRKLVNMTGSANQPAPA